jgi:hypothetical protein
MFSSNHTTLGLSFVVELCSNTTTVAASAALCSIDLPHHSGRNKCPHPRSTTNNTTKSVQSSSARSSSMNMFKAFKTTFQQILTELDGDMSGEDRIVTITEIVLKP